MIYLASPYSHPDLATRNWRFQRARQALFSLWAQQVAATCPIVLGHEFEQRQRTGPQELPWQFWMSMARPQLLSCTEMWVLTLPGWDESEGVKQEAILAHGCGRKIIPYCAFDKCEDVTTAGLMATFGLPAFRPRPIVMTAAPKEED